MTAALALLGCASPGMPPGGPEDPEPPVLVATAPADSSVRVQARRVVFMFDEVVSERPQGATELADLFIISPREGDPEVDWAREEVRVEPRRGFRPNTVYTVTLLPGLADLRGNVRREGATVVFSTGPDIPDTRLAGTVIEWESGRPIANAWVEVVAVDDSTMYVSRADSAGRFELRHLPPDVYMVRGHADPNGNRTQDRREAYDSTRVTVQDSAIVELLAFVHDSVGPGIERIAVSDSVTVRVTFDEPIDVDQTLDVSNFVLLAADSTAVGIAEVMTARAWEAKEKARLAAEDSARVAAELAAADSAADTVAVPAAPAPADSVVTDTPSPPVTRPLPTTEVVLRLARPLAPDSAYRLRAIAIRDLQSRLRTSDRVFEAPPVRRTPSAADSLAVPAPLEPPSPPT
ncbi:MAG: Ig-like domain-containing protein [Gemmatimonadaceae bacterium]